MYPLEDIDVLALESGISAPLCTRLLGDLGARVVKVERPRVGDVSRHWDTAVDGDSSAHVWVNRNKESIELDLKREEGVEIFRELASKADVVVQNFSPGVVDRLGVGYDDLSEENESLLYINISGYGQHGPYADRKAYDLVMQGETGLILLNGSPDAPAKVPISVCDINAGMYGAMAALSGLLQRTTTGRGQEIDVSMFGGVLSWLGYFPLKYLHNDEVPERVGMRHHLLTPYGPHETADDRFINFAVLSEDHFEQFCSSIIERPDLLEDERFETNEKRVEHRDVFEPIVESEIAEHSRDYWAERFDDAGLPWGDVNELPEVLEHQVTDELDLIREMETDDGPVEVIDNPIAFGDARTRCDAMPDLGADAGEILAELGYDDDAIADLRAAEII